MLKLIKLSILTIFFSTLLFAEAPKITSTMTMQELNKLTASDGVADDYFGISVSISGDTAIVGAHKDACANYSLNCGSVTVFERNLATGLFEQSAKLTASDGAANDYFGISVSINDDTVIVGASYDDDKGTDSGSAYIFEKPTTGWVDATQNAKLLALDGVAGDYFGYSVAISGDTVVVGAYYDDDKGTDSGSAYIFEKSTTGWVNATQNAKLLALDGVASDYFGINVAISGDTVVVGAYGDDDKGTDSGSAYIFEKPTTTTGWVNATESAKLLAPDGAAGDSFGISVSISGDTVVVGASGDDDKGTDSGSAYIFEKPTTGWVNATQNAKLLALDGAAYDNFGYRVAISGDTVVVGAYRDDDKGTDSGSAYIFEKPTTGWVNATQNAKLLALDGAASDYFGWSVSISGDTVIVGARGDDDKGSLSGSAYIFKNAITQNSIENKKDIIDIEASDADGDSITFAINGGDDAAYLDIDTYSGILSFKTAPDFENPLDTDGDNIYEAQIKLTDDFYDSDTYSAFIRVSDLEYEGEAPKALSFEELNKMTASDGTGGDYFGISVAISGTTAVVGAYEYNSLTGTAYIYEYDSSSNTYIQQARIRASDYLTGDYFGINVAISGDTVVVGAFRHDDKGTDSGSAYIFEKPTNGWVNATESAKLLALDGAAVDLFGISVSISGDTVVVGAYGDDDKGGSSGSAYIFEKPTTGWENATESAKLLASDGAEYDYFGISVAISGDTVVVGASGDDDLGSLSGSAYIFEKPTTGWVNATQNAKLLALDGAASDYFGINVAISGDTVVVGAYRDDDKGTDSGSAYIFEKPTTGWVDATESAKLLASDGAEYDYFGGSVAISGDTVIVGARSDDTAVDSGSAYLFEKPTTGWVNATESVKLLASDGAEGDYFGSSVSISGDTVVVGAYGDDCADGSIDCGSAYIFKAKESQGALPAIIMYLLN